MRFTFLAAVATCASMALRPQLGRSSAIAKIGRIVTQISSRPSDSLVALKAATGIVSDISAEMGNATDHISGDDAEVLRSVLDLVENTIYSSMDQSQEADVGALASGVDTAVQCNEGIAQRQSLEGDLGTLQQQVQDKQTELNRLQGVVVEKSAANDTKWDAFDTHMQMISIPPACPGFPARNKGALDVFFEKSDYVIWFAAQEPAYENVRDAWKDADSALEDAITDYNLHLAVRDQQYCDWKSELEAACEAFGTCFLGASDFYSNTLVPNVTSDMNGRIEVKKAGDTLIHQIQFLLAEVSDQQTPPIDTSRYAITFPDLPAKGLCDLSPLDDAMWVPVPSCDGAGEASNPSPSTTATAWALEPHNLARCAHCDTPALKWSSTLAAEAAACAQGCPTGHTCPRNGAGENLYWAGSSNTVVEDQTSWNNAIQSWYGEEGDWNYGTSSSNGGVVGHFTQVVWKGTTQVGCAMNVNCNNKFSGFKNNVVVCRYSSPGNFHGQYAANVKKTVASNVCGAASNTCPN